MTRYCFHCRCGRTCSAEYRRRHAEVWPDMLRALARRRLAQLLDLRPRRTACSSATSKPTTWPPRRQAMAGDRGQRPLAGRDEPVLHRSRTAWPPDEGFVLLEPRSSTSRISSPDADSGRPHDQTPADPGPDQDHVDRRIPGRGSPPAPRSVWSPAGWAPTGRSFPACCRSCSGRPPVSPSGCGRWTATWSTSASSPTPSTAPRGRAAARGRLRPDRRLPHHLHDGVDAGAGRAAQRCAGADHQPAADRGDGPRTFDTGQWLAYCGACPLPEIANTFLRAGIPFRSVSGYVEDERAWTRSPAGSRPPGVRATLRTAGTG